VCVSPYVFVVAVVWILEFYRFCVHKTRFKCLRLAVLGRFLSRNTKDAAFVAELCRRLQYTG